MAFCVSYSPKYYERERWHQSQRAHTPYEDWVRRGRPHDTMFEHSEHRQDDIFKMFMRPAEHVVHIAVDLEYYTFSASATVDVDPVAKTVRIDRLLCRSYNVWPELVSKDAPRSGSGGVEHLKANVRFIGRDEASLELLVVLFFGPGWTAVVPLTRPEIAAADYALAEGCLVVQTTATTRRRRPWGKVVASYRPARTDAAVTIQRHFRGWRVRMRTAFDPHTRLGAYYALRAFREML